MARDFSPVTWHHSLASRLQRTVPCLSLGWVRSHHLASWRSFLPAEPNRARGQAPWVPFGLVSTPPRISVPYNLKAAGTALPVPKRHGGISLPYPCAQGSASGTLDSCTWVAHLQFQLSSCSASEEGLESTVLPERKELLSHRPSQLPRRQCSEPPWVPGLKTLTICDRKRVGQRRTATTEKTPPKPRHPRPILTETAATTPNWVPLDFTKGHNLLHTIQCFFP